MVIDGTTEQIPSSTNCMMNQMLSRLRWAGHVIRMNENDPTRKAHLSDPGGKRRKGRPNLRWEERVKQGVGTGEKSLKIERSDGRT